MNCATFFLGMLAGVIVSVAAATTVINKSPALNEAKPEFVECTIKIGSHQVTAQGKVTGVWRD